jgi:hypothetical protein
MMNLKGSGRITDELQIRRHRRRNWGRDLIRIQGKFENFMGKNSEKILKRK